MNKGIKRYLKNHKMKVTAFYGKVPISANYCKSCHIYDRILTSEWFPQAEKIEPYIMNTEYKHTITAMNVNFIMENI